MNDGVVSLPGVFGVVTIVTVGGVVSTVNVRVLVVVFWAESVARTLNV